MTKEGKKLAKKLVKLADALSSELTKKSVDVDKATESAAELYAQLTKVEWFLDPTSEEEGDELVLDAYPTAALIRVQFAGQVEFENAWDVWGGMEKVLAEPKSQGEIMWVAATTGPAEKPNPPDEEEDLAAFDHDSGEWHIYGDWSTEPGDEDD
ncbi:hypothetical protein ACQCX2_13525 [Propionibacteriaceae bacterium Y1700]|uniref:hypothetical protein n=1 Tax=Microlunatus sp. Y1700 TaxID=3418487 RepID=UPI003DA7922C